MDQPTQRDPSPINAEDEADPRHIVDILIEERAKGLLNSPFWPVIRTLFYPLLHYNKARGMTDHAYGLPGTEVLDYLLEVVPMDLRPTGLEHVPREGRVMIVGNHPSGIMDGVAVYKVLKDIRPDLMIFGNRDAIRISPGLSDVIIPVEWEESKRNPAKTKETLLQVRHAFEKEMAVLIFPSGRLAHLTLSGLKERPWLTTTINLVRRNKAPVIPLHIRSRNSVIYYILHFVSNELRDMTLFHEMLNKTNYPYNMTFGPQIDPDALGGDKDEAIKRLQYHVEHGMRGGRTPPFV